MADDTSGSAFEAIKHVDEDGSEWWSARELAKLLDYAVWQNFNAVIEEAIEVCRINGGDAAVAQNFIAVNKVSGKRGPAQRDHRLTRHACYIIAESADGRKPQVAFAKMYFALTTERYELLASTPEDRARIERRQRLARHHAELALRARAANVITSQQFAAFFNAGHRGLYEETVAQIRARKGIKTSQDIADWMDGTELVINDVRAIIAGHRLHSGGIAEPGAANFVHFRAGADTRAFFVSQGIFPEDLPTPTKSYQQLLREEEARQRILAEDATGLWSLLPAADESEPE